MKAIVYTEYGPPDVLRLAEVPRPVPQDHDVLVKVHATTVTAAGCYTRQGAPFIARLGNGLRKPKATVLGSYLAGEVAAAGRGVRRFKEGDRVIASTGPAFGAHAEYVCLPEQGALAPLPANATYGEAAGCDGALTALTFLRDEGKIRRGHRVLVNGASGSVGIFAVQLAKYYGAEVTAVCSGAKAEWVRSLGADRVVDYAKKDFTKSTGNYDIIFDAAGKSSFRRCKGRLAPEGVYLTTVPSPAILLQMLWTGRRRGKKAVIAFAGLRAPAKKAKDLALLKLLVETGAIRPAIDRRYPLAQTAAAHRYVEQGRKRGNVVIDVTESAAAVL